MRQQPVVGVQRYRIRAFGESSRQIVRQVKPRRILLMEADRERCVLLPCLHLLDGPIGGTTVDDQPLEIIGRQRQGVLIWVSGL
jgi:hypothetical protein